MMALDDMGKKVKSILSLRNFQQNDAHDIGINGNFNTFNLHYYTTFMKTTLSLLILCFVLSGCGKLDKKEYRITGEIKGLKDSTMLYLDSNEQHDFDSTMAIKGKFRFKGKLDEPRLCMLTNKPPKFHRACGIMFWIEPSDLKIKAILGKEKLAVVAGSKVNDQWKLYLALIVQLTEKREQLHLRLEQFTDHKQAEFEQLVKEWTQIDKVEIPQLARNYISDHPDFLFSSILLSVEMRKMSKPETQNLYMAFDPSVKESKFGKEILHYIQLGNNMSIGDKAKNIQVESLNGKKIELSNFKGKYTLLEFWSSSCGGCRLEHPNLVANYNKFKNKGFEIFSVSLDQNKKEMERAVKQDGVIWPTGSDWLGIHGTAALTYNINSIPSNFLIDPTGTIIATNIRGENIGKKLMEVLR